MKNNKFKFSVSNLTYFTVVVLFLIFGFSLFGEGLVHAQESQSSLNNEVNKLVQDQSVIIGETMIVKYKDSVSKNDVNEDFINKVSLFGTGSGAEIVLVNDTTALVTYDTSTDLKLGLKRALSQNDVEYAQPLYKYTRFGDYSPTANPRFGEQWYLQNQASGINLPAALGKMGELKSVNCAVSPRCGGETSVKVAVIDSGLNLDGTEIANDSVDVANGSRFFYNQGNTCQPGQYFETLNMGTIGSPRLVNFCRAIGEFGDDRGHGTTVASSIIMENNTTLGVGSAYNTTLLPIALNGEYSYNSYIVGESVKYAVDRGAKVINLSLGTSADDPFLRQSIQYAYNRGVTVVASSGNCGDKTAFGCEKIGIDNIVINPKIYPAEYPEVISVGASNYAATVGAVTRTSYSSFGKSTDVVAGVGDKSVSPFAVHGLNKDGVYSTSNDGTSFSAPVVAGVIALAYSLNPELRPSQIYTALTSSSKDISTPGYDTQTGYGLVDAAAFLTTIDNLYPQWTNTGVVGAGLSSVGQVTFGGRYYQSIRGTDNGIYTRSSADGQTWLPWDYSGGTLSPVSLNTLNNTLTQSVRGTDNGIYTRSTNNGSTWTPWIYSGTTTSEIYTVMSNNRLIQATRGINNTVRTRFSSDAITWSPWLDNGATISQISMAQIGSTVVQSLRGTDNGIYTRTTSNGTSWTPWVLSGYTLGDVTLSALNSRLVQSVRGTDNGVYTRLTTDGITWSNWESSGSTLSDVSLVTFNNRVIQAMRGTDNVIYTRSSSDGISWSIYLPSGSTTSRIGLSSSTKRLYQTVLGTDGVSYTRVSLDTITWSDWSSFGRVKSIPSIIEAGAYVNNYVLAPDNSLTQWRMTI